MNVNIRSINFKPGTNLESFIRRKVNNLLTKSNELIRADIILQQEKNRSFINKICEIRLVVPGYDHFVKKNTREFYTSVSEAVHALQKILKSAKTKKISKRYPNNHNGVENAMELIY